LALGAKIRFLAVSLILANKQTLFRSNTCYNVQARFSLSN